MTINLKEERDRGSRNAWNVHDDLKGRSLESLRSYQTNDSLPFGVCVVNLHGDLNVGIILRTAALTGARNVFVFGRKGYDKRSTVGANKYLNVQFIDGMVDDYTVDHVEFHLRLFESGYYPVFIEQGGTPLSEYDWNHHPLDGFLPCVVMGNEANGIPESLMRSNDAVVSIEQRGVIRSFNVSSAASIVLYDISQKIIKLDTPSMSRNHMMAF